jgi:penicillin-binding protein 2
MERFKLSLSTRERIGLAGVFLALLFLGGGLVKLQVVDHAELAKQSENNRIRVVPVVPRRGHLLDREGRVIVDNRPSYTVSVVPAEEVVGKTVPNLARLIGLDTLEIRRRIKKNTVSRYQPAAVKKDIPFEVVAVLEEQHEKFPGVSYQMERVRQYVHDYGVEAVTGHVNEVSPEELEKTDRDNLRPGNIVGKKGLERALDQELRGEEGTEYIEVFASGQILGPYEEKVGREAVPGADVTLTIDLDLQEVSVRSLDTFCCGAVVAMDPRSGEIIAMTSYPTYDANIFSTVIPDDLWQEIANDSTHPLLNRPLGGLYPPGSTFKLITVGAGLEEHVITPNTVFKPCLGGYRFGNRVFHCWDRGGHGILNAVHALEQSCDIYMYQLGLLMGVDVLSDYIGRCGFGVPTGIEVPGEAAGLNPNSAYYDRRYGRNKWTRGVILNNSIGQGEILVTPLQLTQFYCGLANNGVVYRPHLVKEIAYSDGEVERMMPKKSFTLPFSASTLKLLDEGLRLVVEGEHGTARSLRNRHYSVGGKTGTAQNPHGEDHSLFVGVAPMDNPEIVVCAIIENAGHGSEVAAPVVGRIIEAYMNKAHDFQEIAAASRHAEPQVASKQAEAQVASEGGE